MATTFTKIASVSVGLLGSSTISFTSIPGTYTDLCLKVSARTDAAGIGDYLYMSLNGNTSNNSYKQLQGSGSAASSSGGSGATNNTGVSTADGATATANTFGNAEIYIPNYAGSTAKSASGDGVSENNATAARADLWAYLNSGTSAITSISLAPGNGVNFVQYTTATLYGIKNS
jgi:hypothetical protein